MRKQLLLTAITIATYAQNFSTPVREVEKPHRAPYQASASVSFGYNCANCANTLLAALPVNKRLVVEHVAVSVITPATGEFHCMFGQSGGPFLPLEAPRKAGSQAIIGAPVRMYLDAAPFLVCTRNESSNIQWNGNITVIGYLVDKP